MVKKKLKLVPLNVNDQKLDVQFLNDQFLWPILFNIFTNDILMNIEQSDICHFADNNTLYSCGEWSTEIKENLVFDTKDVLNWFRFISISIH